MTRTLLLGAASAAALVSLSTASLAKKLNPIQGGGSTLAQFDYIDEFGIFNANKPKATFSTYWESGSGTGQQAFITDDLTCDIDKVTGANGGACAGPAGGKGNTVDYGASDAVLSSSQISSWATSSFGQSAAGDLIQLPSMGVGVSIPVVNSKVTADGQLTLSDNDLCGIFSGLLTDFSQITDTGASLSGKFNVAYRSDGSGTSFITTTHLSAVCTAGNTAPGITFTATTSFASLFPNNTPPATFVGEQGSGGVASYLAGCLGTVANAMGYLSPDFTKVDPNSDATINCNGSTEKSPLVVANLLTGSTANLPTVALVTTALTHVKQGSNSTPPSTKAEAQNPSDWVPIVDTVSSGYALVGYTTFDFAQCYALPSISNAVQAFLKDHFKKAAYEADINKNGFVTLKNTKASTFLTAIEADILANKNGFNTDIGDATVCKGLAGR